MKIGMKHSTLEAQERTEELTATKSQFGALLKKLRTERKAHSLRSLSSVVGVSAKYLSEIENGVHLPQDELIYKLANEFQISELKMFKVAKRVPYSVRIAIEQDERLQDVVYELAQLDEQRLEEIFKLLRK